MAKGEERTVIFAYLAALPDSDILCHFDFHPGNILLSDGQPCIIEWMTVCVGNPSANVARTCVMLQHAVVPIQPALLSKAAGLSQKSIGKNYRKECLHRTGNTEQAVARWYLPIMAARLGEWIPPAEKDLQLKKIRAELATI